MKTAIITLLGAVMCAGVAAYVLQDVSKPATEIVPTVDETQIIATSSATSTPEVPTERYSAQVDRVKVLFEQWDYTRYRLQTNELVREGEMNSERGFGDDSDATVYVLNWQAPEGQQIRYVRLSAEPGYLYALDGYQNIIKSGRLVLEN
jgi:hypothetical protein